MASYSGNTKPSTKRGGRSCVAGGPGGQSCKNTQFMEGVSIHTFPDKNSDLGRYWIYIGLTILTIRSDDSHANYPPVFL